MPDKSKADENVQFEFPSDGSQCLKCLWAYYLGNGPKDYKCPQYGLKPKEVLYGDAKCDKFEPMESEEDKSLPGFGAKK